MSYNACINVCMVDDIQTTYNRLQTLSRASTQERVFAVKHSTRQDKQRLKKVVAGNDKKTSGGVWSKDGIETGQRANSCDTSFNLTTCESEEVRLFPFQREYHTLKRNKKVKQRVGKD